MRANCGHIYGGGMTDHRGYTWCSRCASKDAEAGIRYGNRAVVEFDNGYVHNWNFTVIGTVLELVERSRGKNSMRMTIVDKLVGRTWYANGPKTADGKSYTDFGPITLRSADES